MDISERPIIENIRLCKCGCGGSVKLGKLYVYGHNRRGCVHTDKAKRKIGESKKGNQYALGYRHTEEAKKKISLVLLGNQRGLGKGASHIGLKHTEETKKKIGFALKGQQHTLGFRFTQEQKEKLSKIHLGHHYGLGYKFTDEQRRNAVKAGLKRWSNPLYREAQVKAIVQAVNIKPNKAEIALSYILRHIVPHTFCYNGDFRLGFSIGGKIPDFVNMNSKKQVIELFGDYWHKGQNPEILIKHYAKYHYDCLVIWEYELKDKENVKSSILSFMGDFDGCSKK